MAWPEVRATSSFSPSRLPRRSPAPRAPRSRPGSGQPVALVVTVGGESAAVCNSLLARVDVVFRIERAMFRRGNVNDDSKVDIADGIWIINEILRSGPVTLCQDAAGANDDGAVDVSDGVYLFQYQFQPPAAPSPDPPPPPPFDDCGTDPTDDAVGCASPGCP